MPVRLRDEVSKPPRRKDSFRSPRSKAGGDSADRDFVVGNEGMKAVLLNGG